MTTDTPHRGHTPLPWDLVPSCEHHGPYITSDYGSTIADFYTMSDPTSLSIRNGGTSKPIHFMHEMADANAALVVRAVNSHYGLIEALEAMLRHSCVADAHPEDKDAEDHAAERMARAALKAARGES